MLSTGQFNMLSLPDFDDLPRVEGMPQGCAWGIFDRDGEKDIFGTLNILTPDVVKAAAQEIQEGVSISLKSAIYFHLFFCDRNC